MEIQNVLLPKLDIDSNGKNLNKSIDAVRIDKNKPVPLLCQNEL